MRKKDIDLLARAFSVEIEAALSKSPLYMMQTRAEKRADALVDSGMLKKVSVGLSSHCTVSGYALTDLGRMTYCMGCSDA